MKTGLIKMILRSSAKPKLPEPSDIETKEDWPQNISNNNSKYTEDIDRSSSQLKGIIFALEQVMKTTASFKRSVEIEPRDRRIQYQLPEAKNPEKLSKEEIELWVTGLCRQVFSTTFNYYQTGLVSYEQAKIFCSENIISNIIRINEKYSFSSQQIRIIDQHIENGVSVYLLSKYPMTETQISNKALESIVKEVDSMEALENDVFFYSKDSYGFEFRESGNYNDLIMKFMNDLMTRFDQKDCKKKQSKTVFNQFYQTMQKFFEKVENRDWMEKGTTSSAPIEECYMKNIENNKYKSRVKAYTSAVICRKISENASLYSDAEINSLHMTIRHPAILRILTKWCEQLWEKFETKNYFLDSSENVKTQKGENINTYFAWMKTLINDMIEQEKIQIEKFLDQLFSNNYDQQAVHLFRSLRQNTFTNVERIEKASGIFAVNIVDNLHSYILLYLNRLIHGLLQVSKKFYCKELIGKARWTSPPNLISFKIGDMMRCKVTSQEKEILELYKELISLSESDPDHLKIVRIKNRLKEGTNDILINIRFHKVYLCEIQLAINSDHSKFIKCSNKYNHFIYELKRSIFGPLTEFCSIWRSLDGRSKIYQKMATTKTKVQPAKIPCLDSQKQHKMMDFNRPFVCSKCDMTYSHNNYIESHIKCVSCMRHSECGKCRLEAEQEQSLKHKLFKQDRVAKFCTRLGQDEQIPKHGVCFLIQSKQVTMQLFAKLTIKGKTGLFIRQNGKIDQLISLNHPKDTDNFKEKYIIFKLSQNDGPKLVNIEQGAAKNEYVLPKMVKTIYKKEKQFISLIKEGINDETCSKILDGSQSARENIKCLELADNEITNIDFICNNFKNLKRLVLSRNRIKNIDSIGKLINLEYLNLRDNQIQVLPSSLFNLHKLISLNLRSNLFRNLPPEISLMTNLTKIELNELKLRSLPESFSKMVQLRYVDLSENELREVPSVLKPLINIEHLGLSGNQIREVPVWLKELTSLSFLDLKKNNIVRIKSILELKVSKLHIEQQLVGFPVLEPRLSQSLSLLVMNKNKVKRISNEFFVEARSLEKIEMKDNQLEVLPESLGVCQRMKSLNLAGNKLTSLPKSFSSLINLKVLELSSNNFEYFPKQLNCSNLIDISLANNPLLEIPKEFFNIYTKIESINLAKTKIQTLPPKINTCLALKKLILSETNIRLQNMSWLSELRCLQELDISNMKLRRLPSEITELSSLHSLIASENDISSIPENFFLKLNHILSLDLEKNKLKTLPSSFKTCSRVKTINLSHNSLTHFPTQIYGFHKLHQLNLSHNSIGKINSEKSLPSSLIKISLNSNKISDICDAFFKNADNLNKLNLDNNLLTQIPRNLKNCAKLIQTSFKENYISMKSDLFAKEVCDKFVDGKILVMSEQDETNTTDLESIVDSTY